MVWGNLKMPELVQIGVQPSKPAIAGAPKPRASVLWIQGVTLAWMLVEFGVSAYAAVTAHSPAMLAFGSDSLVELLSAAVVLLQWIPSMSISERRASRTAGALLFVLAFVVAAIAVASLALRLRPATSYAGIAITIAALIAMPVLAFLKRREARRSQECSFGRRCSAIRYLRVSCAHRAGWPRYQCGIPCRMVRFGCRFGGCSHPREGGQIGLARPCLSQLSSPRAL